MIENTSDLIVFGQAHDCNRGKELTRCLNQTDVAIMDRSLASQDLINYCCQSSRYFVVRINRNYHLYLDEKLGYLRCANSSIDSRCRIIILCNLKKRTEYRIATNLPPDGENSLTNSEISEIYP
jgi:hypothetical protein